MGIGGGRRKRRERKKEKKKKENRKEQGERDTWKDSNAKGNGGGGGWWREVSVRRVPRKSFLAKKEDPGKGWRGGGRGRGREEELAETRERRGRQLVEGVEVSIDSDSAS